MDQRQSVRHAVESIEPTLDPAALDEHFGRVDEGYLERHSPGQIARHVRLSAQLGTSRPVRVEVRPVDECDYEVTVVAYDYFGELALLCGLLTSFGLDIRSGRIYTFGAAAGRPTPARRGSSAGRRRPRVAATKIVDVFVVRPVDGVVFGAEQHAELAGETEALFKLVSEGALSAARDRLNRRLVERLETGRSRFARATDAVRVSFGAASDADWTVMEVRAQDTPAFLYALANALSLRGVYIHHVEMENVGEQVRDRFFISDRFGKRIDAEDERAALRTAVGLTKQFTHFLTSAPDPAAAIHAFDQLVDVVVARDAQGGASVSLSDEDLDALAHLLGSSRFLWEDFLRAQVGDLLPLLRRLKAEPLPRGRAHFASELGERLAATTDLDARRRALNEYKDRAMVLIDLKQLLDPNVTLPEFSAALTELAEAVLASAIAVCGAHLAERHGWPRLPDGSACPVAAFGLGKFGGGELGYGSDIELLLVYGGSGHSDGAETIENAAWCDALARGLLELVEARRHGIFEIDLRLRPYGRKGQLASVVEQIESYYSADGEAAPFERQALVKLRWVAGDETLGRRVESVRDRFVYGAAPWDRETSLHLRWRQLHELVEPGAINVKYGAGGMIDVEYAVQYLQVQHGSAWIDLRTPNTLSALSALKAHGLVSVQEHEQLLRAYLFLRRVVDALRMVRGNAKDLVLPAEDSDEYMFLARRLGVRRESWAAAATALAQELRSHMAVAHEFYVSRFGEPQATAS
jgi:glutamate-ammonia-ligase adenylyltransferase